MKLAFMGTPAFAVPTLKALMQSEHEVCLVVTQPDKARGRSKSLLPPPVKEEALRHGVPVLQPVKLREDSAVRSFLVEAQVEAVIVVAYGQMIPDELLDMMPFINIHASLLPCFRGAAPINRAILEGHEKTGVSIMRITSKMDAGPVYATAEMDIDDAITAAGLTSALSEMGGPALLEVLPAIADGSLQPVAQDEALVTYAPMLSKEEGRIDWRRPARAIHNQIRGLDPWPGAYTSLDGKTLKLKQSSFLLEENCYEPGTLIKIASDLRIACPDGFIRPAILQLEGKRAMDVQSFCCGLQMCETLLK